MWVQRPDPHTGAGPLANTTQETLREVPAYSPRTVAGATRWCPFGDGLLYSAFLDLGGGDFYESEGVPVANGAPSNVQANTHWRSEIIDNEIMVGCDDVYAHFTEGAECGEVTPVSAITLGALADMGWIVDMGMAEPGTRTGCFRSCRDW